MWYGQKHKISLSSNNACAAAFKKSVDNKGAV
jgi:hypothetical protein